MEMVDFPQMAVRFILALALGALIGLERELIGKEAGVRTSMIVSGGAALFTLAGLALPYFISTPQNLPEVIARNSGFLSLIANIVIGIGFLGAGIIIKTDERVHGLTTAAVIWFTASVGILVGIGLIKFAIFASVLIAFLLYLLRRVDIARIPKG